MILISLFSLESKAHGPRFKQIATTGVIAKDANSEWTASDVAGGTYDEFFSSIEDSIPNLDFTTATFWLKFDLSNETDAAVEYYLETGRPLTNKINLYEINSSQAQKLFAAGDNIPFISRPVIYRKFVFPITLAPGESNTYLFEAGSDGEVLTMPIKLWEKDNFNGFIQRENLTLGIYFGLLIFVAGLFGFFALVIRERIYVYYVAYIIFLFFMQASLDGLAFEYFWPQSPWLANHSILFFSAASVFMLMLYAAEYLTLSAMPKWFKNTYKGLLGLVLICAFTGLTSGFLYEITYPLVNGLSLVSLLAIIGAIFWKQRSDEKVNIFFALGFLAVLAGGIVFILTNFNIIYSDFLSQNAIKLGSAGEVTFLSLAMVSRYREVEREKEIAQNEAFENLEALNKVTKNQKERLEKIVIQRTAEIRNANEQLEEKNKEIIDSITYAKRIQEAILPSDSYFFQQLPDSFVLYIPKDIVAGDFYWMQLMGNKIIFAAADCTGHGVPGAMVSVVCHNSLNRAVREYGQADPGIVLDLVARMVEETFSNSDKEVKDGMDISVCAYDPKTMMLEWAGANNPLWIVTSRDLSAIADRSVEDIEGPNLYEIKPDKQPIGHFADRKDYTSHSIQLEKGDTIYVFSDGYADQFGGEKGKKYKTKNMKEFVLGIQDKPIKEHRVLLENEFHHWRGDLEQIDDVCVIGMRV